MAMSLVAGFMVDRVGLKTCVFLFLSFCMLGSALFGLSFTLTSLSPDARYILMFVGRFIFGLGGYVEILFTSIYIIYLILIYLVYIRVVCTDSVF